MAYILLILESQTACAGGNSEGSAVDDGSRYTDQFHRDCIAGHSKNPHVDTGKESKYEEENLPQVRPSVRTSCTILFSAGEMGNRLVGDEYDV